MKQVIKRDGKEVKFNLKKIVSAIRRAGESSGEFGYDEALDLTNSVIQMFDNKEKATVEEIQDAVEKVLNENNYTKTARAFIVYREKHNDMRKDNNVMIDAVQSIDDYLDRSDWRVNANANQGYSLGGMILNTSGKVTANYWLSHVYPKEAGEAHRNGDIQIHDLDMLANYCTGWSLRALLQEGFNGVKGKVESNPPKHLASALGQMVNFWGCLQNENAGAQAFSSFDTYLAPYVRNDKLTYKQVYDAIQEFVFNVNVPSRWGTQTPFTNITLDWTCPEDLKDSQPIIAGEEMDYTYSELQPEMDMINKAFIEVMIKGDAHGRLFTFPIPTYNITPDFPWGSENTKLLFEMTAKYGLPYFQNFLNSDLKVGDVRSMCPLTGDTEIWCRTTKGTHKLQIQEMYRNFHRGLKYEFYEVWDGYRWCKASVNKQYDSKVYEITLGNGDVVKMGSKHLQYVPELKSSITAEYLKVGMFLPYNSKPMNIDVVEGSKLAGEIVGIFAGDGSFDGDGVVFSLSSEMKDDETEEKIRSFFNPLGIVVLKRVKGGLRTLWVGKGSADFIRRFISGTALNKKFEKKVFTLSNSFLEGVLNGFRLTDGSRSRSRLYTSSRFLVNDLVSIASLVGRKHSVVYEDKREGRLGENVNYRVDLPLRESYGDLFKCIDNFDCYPIKKISLISDNKKPLYCLEVQNDSHLFTLANGLLTHNCRLQLDLREIKKRGGGLFGSGEQTGSIGVITINCARLGYLFKNDITGLYKRLDELMNIARNALEQKRKSLNKWMEQGLYPYSKRYLGGYNTLFSTIGINGVNEMIRNFTNDEHDITDDYGQKFAMSLMDHINEVLKQFQVETGNLYNLEATPGEGTTFRFAKEDKKRYPDIIQAGKPEAPYYTNSTQIPVGYTNDPFTALNLQEGLQRRYSGGTVVHLYMGEAMSSSDSCKTLVKRVLENYHIPYLTITPTFSICPKHGYISGEHKYCPICDEELTSPKQEQCKACKC